MQWMLRVEGEESGPFTSPEVRDRIKGGELPPTAEIRKADESTWRKVTSIRGYRAKETSGDEGGTVEERSPYDVFVSHSNHDKATADALVHVLESRGLRCWIAPRDIVPGSNWSAGIMEGLSGCRALVLVFSAHSNQSQQVLQEVERAVSRGLPIVPFRIEDVDVEPALELFIGARHWLDALSSQMEVHLEELGGAVEHLLRALDGGEGESAKRARPGPRTQVSPGAPAVTGRRSFPIGILGAAAAVLLAVAGGWWWLNDPRVRVDAETRRDFEEYADLRDTGDTEAFYVERGPVRYRAWLDAAERGHPRAQFLVGLLVSDGNGTEQDVQAGLEWFRKSAEQGDPAGINALGFAYDSAQGVEEDDEVAFSYYLDAAEKGDVVAMTNVGFSYRNGLGSLAVDLGQARLWYERSAEAGNRTSMRALAQLLKKGGEGVEVDLEAAESWNQRAAEAGEVWAQAEVVVAPLVAVLDRHATAISAGRRLPILDAELASVIHTYEAYELRAQLAVLGDWRVTQAVNRVREVDPDAATLSALDSMVEALVERYATSRRKMRERTINDFASATEDRIVSWSEAGKNLQLADFWAKTYQGLALNYQEGSECRALFRHLNACVTALFAVGRRAEAEEFLESVLQLGDTVVDEVPWNWWAKNAYARLCFDAAEAVRSISSSEDLQDLLQRAWRIEAYVAGREDLLTKFEGRLPLRGEVPAGADAKDTAFFMSHAPKEEQDEFNRTAEVKTDPLKKFTVPAQFGETSSEVDLYVTNGPNAYLELQDQVRWLEVYRGGVVAEEIRGAFQKLFVMAREHDVSYADLCAYAVDDANEKKKAAREAAASQDG